MVFGLTNMMGGAVGGDPHFASVSALFDFEGADGATSISDLSNSAHSVTVNGNAQLDTAIKKFGGSSLLLDGSGDYLSMSDADVFDLDGDFTIEAWVYATGGSAYRPIWDCIHWNGSQAQHGFGLNSSGTLSFYFFHSGNNFHSSTGSVPLNTWTHVALVRDGSSVVFYIDGVASGSFTTTLSFSHTGARRIGYSRRDNANRYFQGNIDELRITKGVARYTSGFTPPDQAFPTS